MKKVIHIFCLFFTGISFSQCLNTCGANLIPNPSFESPTGFCNNTDIQIYSSQTPVANWFGTDNYPLAGSSPDYFSSCAGSTNPPNNVCFDGSSRIGVFAKTSFSLGREYVQAQLTSTLIPGKTYCYSMVVKSRVGAAGNLLNSTDGIGAWFHGQGLINIQTMNGGNQFLGPGSTINALPQIENPSGNMIGASCVTVSGTFCATGNEEWVVIGNFKDDANTTLVGTNPSSYLYIDDVQLFELCDPILDLTASSYSINCPDSVNLIVSSTFPSGTVYTWSEPTNNNLSGISNITVAPITTTTYSLIATFTNSCGIQSDTESVQIQVIPCGVSAQIYDTLICQGECHDLQFYNLNGGQSPYSIEWTNSLNQVIGTSSAPIQVCPSIDEWYYLRITDSLGEEFYDSLFINVNEFPIIFAGNDTSVCLNESVILNGVNDIGLGSWLNLGVGNTFTVSPSANTQYIFEVNNLNCISRDTIQITVNSLPDLQISKTNITCFGLNNGTVTVNVNGNSPFNYNWHPTSGANLPSISNLPNGWEFVEVLDSNGCRAIDSVLIIEPIKLEISITGDSILCQNETTTLNVLVTGGIPIYSISWENGSVVGALYSSTFTNSEYVSVVVTDSNLCTSVDSLLITINQNPTASFDGGIKICQGVDTLILNNSINADSYTWIVNGNESYSNDLNFNETSIGCYDIILIAENSFQCFDTLSDSCTVEVIQNPIANFYPSSYTVLIDNPVVTIFNNSQYSTSCQSFVDEQQINNTCDYSFNYEFEELGNYSFNFIVQNDFGCIDSTSFKIEVREGLIYYVPNSFTPDGNEFNNEFKPIFTSGFDPSFFSMLIYDRWGEVIFESKDYSIGWDGNYKGEVSKEGSYVWVIEFKDFYTDKRIQINGHVNLIR